MTEWRKDLLPCPFCGNPPCHLFRPNPNGEKYPGHHEIWCESLDCDVGAEVSEVDLSEAERLWNKRVPSVAQALPSREKMADIIGYHLAAVISGNNQPHMSGDPRARLVGSRRRHFDDCCLEAAAAILSPLPSTSREAPSDGAIYTEVSRRSITPEEDALLMKALRDGAEMVEELSSTVRESPDYGYCTCGRHASDQCDFCKRHVDGGALPSTQYETPADLYAWPIGCHSPNSCRRNGRCMYVGCKHDGTTSMVSPAERNTEAE